MIFVVFLTLLLGRLFCGLRSVLPAISSLFRNEKIHWVTVQPYHCLKDNRPARGQVKQWSEIGISLRRNAGGCPMHFLFLLSIFSWCFVLQAWKWCRGVGKELTLTYQCKYELNLTELVAFWALCLLLFCFVFLFPSENSNGSKLKQKLSDLSNIF